MAKADAGYLRMVLGFALIYVALSGFLNTYFCPAAIAPSGWDAINPLNWLGYLGAVTAQANCNFSVGVVSTLFALMGLFLVYRGVKIV